MEKKGNALKKPIIGINMDFEEKGGGYSLRPYHALGNHYLTSILKYGGTPIALPSTNLDVDAILGLVDGVLLTGGNDYDPALFGASNPPELNLKIMHQRSLFDFLLAKKALEKRLPVLGICAGMQAINCIHGGTLFLDIATERVGSLNHLQPRESMCEPAHSVALTKGTRLHGIVGEDTLEVNSRHHQALKVIGEGLVVSAVAPDGIVEAIEHPFFSFCIGVEWHPEFDVSEADGRLMRAFVDACLC